MSDSGYQRRDEANPTAYFLSHYFFLILISYLSLLLCYTAAVTLLYNAEGAPVSQYVSRAEVAQTVVLEGLHGSLGDLVSKLPQARGVAVARINARLILQNALIFHCVIGFIAFAAVGYISGRFGIASSAAFLPIVVFWHSYSFLEGSFLRLIPLNTLLILAVLLVQMFAAYGFALWGKWSGYR
jgi:hypothetical protein